MNYSASRSNREDSSGDLLQMYEVQFDCTKIVIFIGETLSLYFISQEMQYGNVEVSVSANSWLLSASRDAKAFTIAGDWIRNPSINQSITFLQHQYLRCSQAQLSDSQISVQRQIDKGVL